MNPAADPFTLSSLVGFSRPDKEKIPFYPFPKDHGEKG